MSQEYSRMRLPYEIYKGLIVSSSITKDLLDYLLDLVRGEESGPWGLRTRVMYHILKNSGEANKHDRKVFTLQEMNLKCKNPVYLFNFDLEAEPFVSIIINPETQETQPYQDFGPGRYVLTELPEDKLEDKSWLNRAFAGRAGYNACYFIQTTQQHNVEGAELVETIYKPFEKPKNLGFSLCDTADQHIGNLEFLFDVKPKKD
jgi:hypothetical protein